MDPEVQAASRHPRLDVVGVGLILFGLQLLAIAVMIVIAPGFFFDQLGPFGVRNDHYLHDVAAFQGGLGTLLLLAARRPTWRVPALAVAVVTYALHTLAHLADIDLANRRSVGIFDFASLAVLTVILVWLLSRARRDESP